MSASEEVGKHRGTNYMFTSRHQDAGQDRNLQLANGSFESMAKFRHLGMTVRNPNLTHERIKSRLNSCNVCYHSVQNLLVFSSPV
jgi:hypothetical protein